MKVISIPFAKCQAYGNDFILAEETPFRDFRLNLKVFSEKICLRKYAVGADCLILWKAQKRKGYYKARIFNSDGSEAESSGNGLRCLATALRHLETPGQDTYYFETSGSIKKLIFQKRENNDYYFRSNLGEPSFEPAGIPFTGPLPAEPSGCHPLEVDGRTFSVSVLSTGNPHCVIRVPVIDFPTLYQFGSRLETHPFFPSRTNVEFVHVINRNTVEIAVWERGVGHTLSSGTGSAAAAVACIRNGWTDPAVQVHMEGGEIMVSWSPGQDIIQEGKAQFVFQGTIESLSVQY